ncbi:MAG: Chromate resistance protein ChrB [Sphaerochaetaceae bacterium]
MEPKEWLTINYSLPKGPSRVRVSVWRKLKKSGAVILGQSIWFLPVNETNETFLQTISAEITQNGGESYVMRMIPHNESTAQHIVSAFNQARDEEYTELLEQCDDLLRELEMKSEYGASLHFSADEKLGQCRTELETFSSVVYRQYAEVTQ